MSGFRLIRLGVAFGVFLALGSLTTSVSEAALFEVNNTDDDAGDNDPGDGDCRVPISVSVTRRCTLRAAIEEANARAGIDSITLPSGTIRISRGLPEITGSLTITGRGAGSSIIAAQAGTLETFGQILSTKRETVLTLRITGVTIQGTLGGSNPANSGVFCHAESTCFITSSVIRDVRFEALRALRANVSVVNSTLTANGTAVLSEFGGNITIDSSSITANINGVQGPAFQGAGGIVTINNGTVTVLNSTIAGNTNGHPNNTGAGAISNSGQINLTNTTIAGNAVSANGTASAIALNIGSIVMKHVTIAGNAGKPAIVATGSAGSLQMLSSIVAGNSPVNCAPPLPIVQMDKNIDSGSSCGFDAGHNFNNVDPLLGPLTRNGGPTQTRLQGAGSPAIDQAACFLLTDQRGVTRPLDGDGVPPNLCDIGAVERPVPITFNLPPLGVPGISPSSGNAAPDQPYNVAFRWDVPAPINWGSLTTLDLRLRSDGQVVFGVRWDQLTDLFQLLDANGNPIEPLFQAGTPILLGDGPVQLDLDATRRDSTGVTGQQVALTLPLIVRSSLAGKVLQVEVAGSGDAGNRDPFVTIGTITVAGGAQAISDNDKRDREKEKPLTELGRLKKARSNDGGFDDEQTEGNVMAVRCEMNEVDIASMDGIMVLNLRGDSRGSCQYIKVGDYVIADGQKETEQFFWVDNISVDK